MKCNQILLNAFFFVSHVFAYAQTNFTYTPQHPKAGDVITFSYTPDEASANAKKTVQAIVFFYAADAANYFRIQDAVDLSMVRKGKQYTGTIQSDKSQNFLFIGFSTNTTFNDSYQNDGEGFSIFLSDSNGIKRGAYNSLAKSYEQLNKRYGVTFDWQKTLNALEKEMAVHPEDKKKLLADYIRIASKAKEQTFPALVQKEIEWLLKEGLTTEEDYTTLEAMYTLAGLPEQAKFISSHKKEKFPNGKWAFLQKIIQFQGESDPAKVEAMIPEITNRIQSDENLKELRPDIGIYKAQVFDTYVLNEDWEGLKTALDKSDKKEIFKSFYTNFSLRDAVNLMQKKNTHLDFAEELSKMLIENGKKELKILSERQPTASRKKWYQMREFHLATFKNSYAMVLYRQGRYKEGFRYAKEAMDVNLKNHEGYVDFITSPYAQLAEKVLPIKEYKPLLEKLVKEGKYNTPILDVLKRSYVKERGTAEGLEDYVAELRRSEMDKLKEELQKSLIKETAPDFSLFDLAGNEVKLTELKGKVVVLDFWSTWCGPCIASFPAMQKVVNHYKGNPDVQFLFIDVAERGLDRKKTASDFIAKNKYSFRVLIDEEDRVFKHYVKEGSIPAKFVIDGNGNIRFKTIGYNSSDLKLIDELKAMIEIASEASKNNEQLLISGEQILKQ